MNTLALTRHCTSQLARLVLVSLTTGLLATAQARGAACEAERPAQWPADALLRWQGPCVQGHATGLGVLRSYAGDEVKQIFYGRLEQGALSVGVIELPGGYQAGRFSQGKLLPTDDRQVTIDAFNLASKAASQAAERFRKAGNTASAQFYQRKAQQLADQMD